jgi:hypothetical protein
MKRSIAAFIVLLTLLLAVPWVSYAGHGRHGGTRVVIGGNFWFGPPPFWGPRFYYGGPVCCAPPPVWVAPTAGYVDRDREESEFWYYCEDPRGYFPYIRSCPGGWMKVVPQTVPSDR